MHDPKYVTKWCQYLGDHVVRDMKHDGVGSQDTNWTHPPCANVKFIMQLSGVHETDGRRESDEFAHNEDWSEIISFLSSLIAQFTSVIILVPAHHFALWGNARENIPQAGPLFRVTETILALRSQGAVMLPMENFISRFTKTLNPSNNMPIVPDSNDNLNTMHSITTGLEAMGMVPMTNSASEWNQRIRTGNSLPFLPTDVWKRMFPFACPQQAGYRNADAVSPDGVMADALPRPELFKCMRTGELTWVPFAGDRVNRERLLAEVNTLNGVVNNRTVILAFPAITPATFEEYWFMGSVRQDILARGPCRLNNQFFVAFFHGINPKFVPAMARRELVSFLYLDNRSRLSRNGQAAAADTHNAFWLWIT